MRPQFLLAGLFLNILGIAVAMHLGARLDFAKAFGFQILVSSLQLAGASANEYADFESDRMNTNRTWFSGGSGVLASGALGRDVAMVLAVFWGFIALLCSIVLSVGMGAPYALLGLTLIGLALALSYSLRPFRLSYTGLGEVTMAVMVSLLVPIASFLVQMGRYDNIILTASVPLFFQMLGLMMVVESPDYAADWRAGKRNLVVRLGRLTSWRLSLLFLILAAASAFYSGLFGVPWLAASVAGVFLLMEALYVYLAEAHIRSMAVMFWSTAVVCGFYLLVIAILAAGFALS
jgi:1,4-dihydroxy-2-naphthoate octaprenyltransferase